MKIIRHPIFLAIVFLALANIALFWKFYFKGLLPFPGNLLVSYYFPWNSGGFAGFDPWTTRKDVIAMDVIRMMYPWKSLVIEQLKSGQWPFWNPYNFSGTPLLANIQTAVFFPTNLIYFILPLLPSWIFWVIVLPLIFSVFWFMFFRSLRLSVPAALLGSICAANLTFLNVWSELVMTLQTILFLPLILWAITQFANTKKQIYLFLIPLFLAFSFFGGHPQTVLYVFFLSGIYFLFQKIPFKFIIAIYFLAITLSSVQLFPTIELYRQSAREDATLQKFIMTTTLPWSNLATIFAPDYYGNPATNNFRKNNYDNSIGYAGIVAIVFAGMAITSKKSKLTNFFFLLAIFGLAFALWPLALIFSFFHLPVLSTGFLSRNIIFFELSVAILAAIGLNNLIKSKQKIFKPILIIFLCYAFLTTATFFFQPADRLVSLKNLILPISIFIICSISILKFHSRFKNLFLIIILGLTIFEYSYFFNKYQPFSPAKFVFPNHPVFSFLQFIGFDRYFGVDRAYIDNNFATYYRVYGPEGYDPLFIRRYGELLKASGDGKFPQTIPSYDAYLNQKDNQFSKKLFDILSIKYLIDKTDEPDKDWGPNENRFPPNEYTFIKQVNKWKYYQRKTALPRAFLAGNFEIGSLEKVYNPEINLRETLILEKTPDLQPEEGTGSAQIINYEPNKVVITTASEKPKLLFLSDNYYPGWKVFVDHKENKILQADYTFRAVAVPAGNHEVIFIYEPLSFYAGLAISLLSFIILLWLFF